MLALGDLVGKKLVDNGWNISLSAQQTPKPIIVTQRGKTLPAASFWMLTSKKKDRPSDIDYEPESDPTFSNGSSRNGKREIEKAPTVKLFIEAQTTRPERKALRKLFLSIVPGTLRNPFISVVKREETYHARVYVHGITQRVPTAIGLGITYTAAIISAAELTAEKRLARRRSKRTSEQALRVAEEAKKDLFNGRHAAELLIPESPKTISAKSGKKAASSVRPNSKVLRRGRNQVDRWLDGASPLDLFRKPPPKEAAAPTAG